MRKLEYVLRNYLKSPRDLWKNVVWRIRRYESRESHVFVVGAPRSGTTLMHSLLGRHCSTWLLEKETGVFSWQNVFSGNHFQLDDQTLSNVHEKAKSLAEYFDLSVAYHRNAKNLSNRRFIEKTPKHVLHLGYIVKHFPKAKIINIVRDGRDCYCSAQSHPNVPQRKSVTAFASYWKKCVNRAELKSTPNLLHVRYEDFVKEPDLKFRELLTWLDLEFEPIINYEAATTALDIRANREVFKRLGEPISSASCGRWQAQMSPKEIDLFQRIAGSELKRWGYIE